MAALDAVRAKVIEAVPEIEQEHTVYCDRDRSYGYALKHKECVSADITLADVLRAMGTTGAPLEFELYALIYLKIFLVPPGEYYTVAKWNLALPLDEQGPEVIEFLHKILNP